ncbi:hypothetical protein ACQKM1_09415 [Peribacillus frigoritolerans]|uniref:hypothetical protein n=1 Tax=Peribacillus frigoritolerans TaxID=450367 RepID=UPI003D0090E1
MKNNLMIHDQTAEIAKEVSDNIHARVMLSRFLDKMSKRGIKYDSSEKELMKLTFHLWMMETQTGSPVVIALPPSFGKSTALIEFALYMTELAPFFGMVVVKDERKQVLEFASEVNERAGRKVAYSLLGRTDEMTSTDYREHLDESQFFPVLVMTKAMFQVRSEMKDIERFAFWTDKRFKTRHRRTTLLLDEPPTFETTCEFTAKKLTGFLDLVREFAYKADGSQEDYYTDIRSKVMLLRDLIEDSNIEEGFLPAIDSSFYLPEKLKKDWSFKYEGDEGNQLAVFEVMVRDGVYKTKSKKKVSLTATYSTHLDWTAFNPFILDGTGHIDSTYNRFNFPTLSLTEEEGKYNHVRFRYHSTTGTYSKTSIKETKNSLDKIADMVIEIAKPYESTMVVCHKEFYDELRERLKLYIFAGEIKLRWFNNGRSSNEFDQCDSAIFIGELDKGSAVHHSVACLRYGNDITAGFRVNRHKKQFSDERVKEVYMNDASIQRIQDVHRLRARNRKTQLDFYFVGKNDDLVREVHEHFSGSTLEGFDPKSEGLVEPPAKVKFANWLHEFSKKESGSWVKAKEVYTEMNVSSRNWTEVKKDPEILTLMTILKVKFEGQKIVKD